MASILIVEDDQKLATVTSIHLKKEGHDVEVAYSLETARLHLKEFAPEIVITDLHIGDDSGLQVLAEAKQEPQQPDVVFITAHADAETASMAMKDGAYEYVTKPFSMDEIAAITKRISVRRGLVSEVRKLREDAAKSKVGKTSNGLVVASEEMQSLLDRVRKVAPLQTTVLVRGESGTGKEVVARFIHENSSNPNCPFVAINCGAIPENLLTSELFGHERGAYTGASARRAGAFERANGGILFLDEMGEIAQATQVALLRVLDHQNLEERVANGKFREDLYYRINVFTASIPPLRERKGDIIPIARHFLKGFGLDESLARQCARAAQHHGEPVYLLPRTGTDRRAGRKHFAETTGRPTPAGRQRLHRGDLGRSRNAQDPTGPARGQRQQNQGRRSTRHHPPTPLFPHESARLRRRRTSLTLRRSRKESVANRQPAAL